MGPPPKNRNFPRFLSSSFAFPHFFALPLLTLICFASSTLQSQPPTIYDHLRKNGLPMGLLPDGITQFIFDPTAGEFQINLTQACNARFENEVHYDFNITGSLSFGKIGNLSGVTQQELFLWFPVKGIRVDVPSSGLIYFDVGVVDKQFSLSLFETAPDCTAVDPGDGIDSSGSEGSKNQPENLQLETGKGDLLRAAS
ncbi:hypothetical protein HS088_TW06G00038 [Tripterygium wilfordii]|uniref:DUF538 family protein n=1 Tax=Tripterygium wilfordii TaxID=458696 RepID=A0A7J7DHU1_TRIWF|nr:uncharacterized protein LOC119999475 [Tripterygium wilfordii]KAF5745873.1 hypothetical protein HS088_TW06G00038 [Tripterygium wilfordii]